MAFHARKSASGSKRWMGCSGSLALEASLPPELKSPTNEAAMTGTCAHALGEYCLNAGLTEVPPGMLNIIVFLDQDEDATIWDNPPDDITRPGHVSAHFGVDCKFLCRVDEKMIEGVQLYLDTVWGDKEEMGPTTEMFVERRFDLSWLRPDMGGTSDCTLYQFMGLLRVIDYKNGYIAVDAEENSQGLYYGLGIAHEVEWLFDELEVVIVQPNSQDGREVKRYRITKEELKAFEALLAEKSDRVEEAIAAFDACRPETDDFIRWCKEYLDVGEAGSNCTFCDAFPVCPAAKRKAEQIAIADFADIPPEVNDMTLIDGEADLDRLQQVLTWGPFLDKLVSAAKELGQRRLEQGLEVPGHKLVAGKANRVYKVDDDTIKTRMKALGYDDEQVLEPAKPRKVKSPAQLEKLGKPAKLAVNGQAEEKEGEIVWVVEPLAIKPEGKLTMVPESDPRAPVVPGTAADDFEGIEA